MSSLEICLQRVAAVTARGGLLLDTCLMQRVFAWMDEYPVIYDVMTLISLAMFFGFILPSFVASIIGSWQEWRKGRSKFTDV